MGKRSRLFGIDRSGAPPPETLTDAPWRPFTIPNAIGFLRLLSIPVFLIIVFTKGPGLAAALLLAGASASDYLDGFLARATGQYSRLGALLDPIADRLLILAGVIACWHEQLLPRWALLALLSREIFMLIGGRLWVKRGQSLRINWAGRLSVWPIFAGIFFALLPVKWLAAPLFVGGVLLSIFAAIQYALSLYSLYRQPQRKIDT